MREQAAERAWTRGDTARLSSVVLTHLVVAVGYRLLGGLSIGRGLLSAWDLFWQNLPREVLRGDVSDWLSNLHMQPPLWNLWGTAALRVCGDHQLACLQAANIGLGAAVCGMVYVLMRQLTDLRCLPLGVALASALHPALLLYEAYALYAILTLFLVVSLVTLLAGFVATGRSGFLVGMVAGANLLALTRSLYHPLVVAMVLAAAVALAGSRRRRVLVSGVLLCLPLGFWLTKNAALFGTVGTSSWQGQNLWKLVASGYSREELRDLAAAGVIDPMVAEVPEFSPPSAYLEWGFDADATSPSLSGDHFNNLNIVAISRAYGRNALRLALRDPLRYAGRVARAALLWTVPSALLGHLDQNRERMGWHARVVDGWLSGVEPIAKLWPRSAWVGLPLLVVAVGGLAVLTAATVEALRAPRCERVERMMRLAVPLACGALISYNWLLSSLFELGENMRFKLDVEPLVWVLAAWSVLELRRRRTAGREPARAGR